ncbi:MAG: prepilin-type N-terminal cleavage/methylation domain-containing protein [Deinococcota bacterium]
MRNRKEGFTLIELLIVIAIIGILAAVLIPNLLDARQRAFDTGAQSCLKELATAQEVYLIDEDVYSPAAANLGALPSACDNVNLSTFAANAGQGYTIVGNHVNGTTTFTVTPASGVQ